MCTLDPSHHPKPEQGRGGLGRTKEGGVFHLLLPYHLLPAKRMDPLSAVLTENKVLGGRTEMKTRVTSWGNGGNPGSAI